MFVTRGAAPSVRKRFRKILLSIMDSAFFSNQAAVFLFMAKHMTVGSVCYRPSCPQIRSSLHVAEETVVEISIFRQMHHVVSLFPAMVEKIDISPFSVSFMAVFRHEATLNDKKENYITLKCCS